jgi:AcrR family transcriptional regulator
MRKTLEDKKLTEISLLKSAMYLFLENGYSKVTIAQIAEHSNLTRGAFYWHFESKEAILNQILIINRNKLRAFLDAQFNSEIDDEFLKIKTIFNNILENFWHDNEFRDFIKLTWFKLENQFIDSSLEYKVAVNDYFTNELLSIIKIGQANGKISSKNGALQISLHATSLINGIYRMYFVSSYLTDLNDVKIMMDAFCDSLKP